MLFMSNGPEDKTEGNELAESGPGFSWMSPATNNKIYNHVQMVVAAMVPVKHSEKNILLYRRVESGLSFVTGHLTDKCKRDAESTARYKDRTFT